MQYRDFSASRREYQAGIRHRAALVRRDAEAKAKAAAEQAASEADRGARQAIESARFHADQARLAMDRQQMDEAAAQQAARGRALVQAEQLSRQAATERTEAARHAEALRAAEQTARREALELTRVRVSREALPVADQAQLGRPDTAQKPSSTVGPPFGDRSEPAGARQFETAEMIPARIPLKRDARALLPSSPETPPPEEPQADREAEGAGDSYAPVLLPNLNASETAHTVEQYARSWEPTHTPGMPGSSSNGVNGKATPTAKGPSDARQSSPSDHDLTTEEAGPAPSWLADLPRTMGGAAERSPVRESLQHSRETVAARWYALRGLFHPASLEEEAAEFKEPDRTPPVLAIYSVAGGVGKTSLAASLTRALAAQGERVLLVDSTERGLLPFYLGARELRPEVIRTFAPPAGSTDQPIHLVSYGTGVPAVAPGQNDGLAGKIKKDGAGFSRVIVDVPSAASEILDSLLQLGADVLVPVAPDMNSILSLSAVRRTFAETSPRTDKHVSPVFLLVQFDPSQPLQLDVREVLQQQLGDHLLPFAIRRSPVTAEALAQGMTVIDYAPDDGIAKDYLRVASWVRTLAEPAIEGAARARWSER